MQIQYSNERSIKRFGMIKQRSQWQDMPNRVIISNVQDTELPNNKIRTSKYTLITFIPLNLVEQFTKMANIYFLIIGGMQLIPLISITNGQPVIFGPLLIVVSISMIKDLIEDYKRTKSDNQENNRKVEVLRFSQWQSETWESIYVGDMVRVQKEEYFPADVVLLASSEQKSKCFIETKSLDGETNLKTKIVQKELDELYKDYNAQDWSNLKLRLNYESPNPYLYKFLGQVNENDYTLALDQSNFVLRGCSLKNTQWCIGLVVYNGHDTKIMLNSVKARPKKSRLELLMNQQIILIFSIQMVVCLFAAFSSSVWIENNKNSLPYLEISPTDPDDSFFQNLITKWGNWILIFTNFVPISLLVSLEMVKLFQGIAITLDKQTISSSGIQATVQTSNLNEELGQISYIFTDKTGTLTKNLMDFKCMTIGGKSYGDGLGPNLQKDEIEEMSQGVTNVDFKDKRFFLEMKQNKPQDPQATRINEFMNCLAICHTVVIDNKDNEQVYNASSPDETALVNVAKYCGWQYNGITEDNQMRVFARHQNMEYTYKLIHTLEFTSTRKRMSLIVQNQQGEYILYTKGADSVLELRLNVYTDPQIKIDTWKHLEEYATIGLRTLILTKKIIPNQIFLEWNERYLKACSKITDREEAVEEIQDEIERDLELLGGTAIEDKLQDDVGSTIQSLKDAGIQIWVLTGDKTETAINIGYACQLLNMNQEHIVIDGNNDSVIGKQLLLNLEKVSKDNDKDFSLVVTGQALFIIFPIQELKKILIQLAEKCKAVIACRVSPKQKQEIVSLVRTTNPLVSTLAIGDGANDVNMITAAHVGVGIRGVEGQQAVRASDFAIGEFKILRRLVLYHGRENYRRNSRLVLYNFFKNMMLVLPQFWFAFNNGFSGVSLYDPFMYQCYNMFYTSLPVIIYALFDEEFNGDFLTNHPSYYEQGPNDSLFNYSVFLYWIGFGAFQAMIFGLLTFPLLEDVSLTNNGWMGTFYATGNSVLGYAIYNGNFKILLMSSTHTIASISTISLSILFFIFNYYLISQIFPITDSSNNFPQSYYQTAFYLATYALIGATTFTDMCLTRWTQFLQYKQIPKSSGQHIELQEQTKVHSLDFFSQNSTVSPSRGGKRYSGYAYSQEEPLDHPQQDR